MLNESDTCQTFLLSKFQITTGLDTLLLSVLDRGFKGEL
jgi:hypothetical protein